MDKEMTVQAVQKELESLLSRMSPGDRVTVLDDEGNPQAVVVRLRTATSPVSDAWEQLERLGREISANWPADKTAAEAVADIRR